MAVISLKNGSRFHMPDKIKHAIIATNLAPDILTCTCGVSFSVDHPSEKIRMDRMLDQFNAHRKNGR